LFGPLSLPDVPHAVGMTNGEHMSDEVLLTPACIFRRTATGRPIPQAGRHLVSGARTVVARLRTLNMPVLEDGTRYRNKDYPTLYLLGLRLAAGETL